MNTNAFFLQGNLMRHVSVMAMTSSIGLMAIFAVDFIDMIFIALLGQDALAAAVGYAGTLLFFTNAINIGISIAAGTLVARCLGANQAIEAKEYATSVALVGVLCGLCVPLLLWPWLGYLLELLGALGETKQLAINYISIILPSMSVMSLAMIGMAVLRSYGDARRSMMATLYGGTVNAVLDPLFIFGFDWQLEGAAWASVIARVTICVAACWPLLRHRRAFAIPNPGLMKRDCRNVLNIAAPAVLANIATPIGNAIVTREMAQFGTEAVAGMAIIGRLMPVAFAVLFALSGAIGPIIGQNFGAQQYNRVHQGYQSALVFSAGYVLLAALVLFVLRQPLAQLFQAEGLTTDILYLFCGPLALASFFNAVIFVSNASFNNLGYPFYSTWVNWGRHTLGTWPLIVTGGIWFGAMGVLIGQAVGGLFFAIIAFVLVRRVINRMEQPKKEEPFMKYQRNHLLCGRGRW